MKNRDIYSKAIALKDAFSSSDCKLPVKINFYIHKNLNILVNEAESIDAMRLEIGKKYGTQDENGYLIDNSQLDAAQKELNDLMDIDIDIKLHKIKLSEIPEDLELTSAQMEALMFLIDDEEKED